MGAFLLKHLDIWLIAALIIVALAVALSGCANSNQQGWN